MNKMNTLPDLRGFPKLTFLQRIFSQASVRSQDYSTNADFLQLIEYLKQVLTDIESTKREHRLFLEEKRILQHQLTETSAELARANERKQHILQEVRRLENENKALEEGTDVN